MEASNEVLSLEGEGVGGGGAGGWSSWSLLVFHNQMLSRCVQVDELKVAIAAAMLDLLKLYEDTEAKQLQVKRKTKFFKLLGECATSLIRCGCPPPSCPHVHRPSSTASPPPPHSLVPSYPFVSLLLEPTMAPCCALSVYCFFTTALQPPPPSPSPHPKPCSLDGMDSITYSTFLLSALHGRNVMNQMEMLLIGSIVLGSRQALHYVGVRAPARALVECAHGGRSGGGGGASDTSLPFLFKFSAVYKGRFEVG
jgi:hypothetical protein